MNDYVKILETEDSIDVTFYIESEKVLAIGNKMNEIQDEAYMNGYNWEAFLNYYLEKNAPDILEEMDTDPEAGMYAAYFEATPENKQRAEKFGRIIEHLIEQEEEIYAFLREHGEDIEWD